MNRDPITVEQLNHSQWHAFGDGCAAKTGATSWVAAVAEALWWGSLTGDLVESVSLEGERLRLMEEERVV